MLTALLLASLATAAGPHKAKIAIVDFDAVSADLTPQAKLLTQVAATEVLSGHEFVVISSAEVRNLLGLERQKQLLGCQEDSACLSEIGGALGVDYMLTGQLGRLGSQYRLDLRLIDARRAQVVGSVGDFLASADERLGQATVQMVRRLLVDAKLRAPEPTAANPLTVAAPAPSPRPSRAPAYVALGATVVLAAAAAFATVSTRQTYADAKGCYEDPARPLSECTSMGSSLGWKGPLADGLWVGTAAAAGLSTYFFLRGPDASSGAGGELGLRGSF